MHAHMDGEIAGALSVNEWVNTTTTHVNDVIFKQKPTPNETTIILADKLNMRPQYIEYYRE